MDAAWPTATLDITEVPYGGRGMGKLDGKVCFVPGVLPGETVEVAIQRDRGTFLEALPLTILSPSPERIGPTCPHAFRCPSQPGEGGCPGCTYQHATYTAELALKQKQLEGLLIRKGGAEPGMLQQPRGAPAPLGYRNKIALHAQVDGTERRLGYFMADNTTILDIPTCPLAVAPINALLEERRHDTSFMKNLRSGMTVTFRWTEREGAVWWRNRAAENDVWLVEQSPAGPLSVPRNSFYQMNPVMAGELVGAVVARLEELAPQAVVDLYCGVGVFALAAAARGFRNVLGMDLDGAGIKAAEYNARKLGLDFIQWRACTAQEGILHFKPGQEAAAYIVDPPRSGLGRAIVRALVTHQPRSILYVSCAPDTMVRDAAWLAEGGYRLVSTQLFDLFPRTAHFESLTLFTRETG